jgi:hypothetical protein
MHVEAFMKQHWAKVLVNAGGCRWGRSEQAKCI